MDCLASATRVAMVGSLLTAPLAVAAAGESVSPSALWGDLAAGPYAAGYRTVFLADRSRTWATPDGRPDSRGRPIRVSVWYPAIAGSQPMRIEDYVRRKTPAEFADAERVLEERDATVVAEWAPPEAMPSLMQARTNAASDATPASGRFPLVLYAGGVNPYTLSNVVLAEFLATHGFVTITVPSLGPSPALPGQRNNPLELEDSQRDLEYAWSAVRDDPSVEPSKLAAMGHSPGGTIALLVALRNANVRAVIGLDGTYGFADGAGSFTSRYDASRATLSAGILDLRRADADVDLAAVRAFHRSDRTFVAMPGLRHGDFTSFVMGAHAFHLGPPPNAAPGWTRTPARTGHEQICASVRDFLRAHLDGDPRPWQSRQAELTSRGYRVSHEPPVDH